MKQSRLAFLLVSTFLSVPALAASVTMLQFGSFETREEAEKRLGEIKKRYSAQVAGLETAVREVALPPDNLVVYRTQAGPVADRPLAQSICSKLAAGGTECYIVQTAMVAPTAAATAAVAEAAKAQDASKLTTLREAAPVPAETPDITRKLSTLQELPERDAQSKQALESVRTASTETLEKPASAVELTAEQAAAPAASEMHAALDKAAAEQTQNEARVEHTVNDVARKPSGSFWSRLNPFSDDEAETGDTLRADEKQDTTAVASAPTPEVKAESMAAVPAELPAVAQKTAEAAPVVEAPKTETAAAAPVITQAEPMVLPPPPAPLKAQETMPVAVQSPATPIETGSIAPMKAAAETKAEVKVEEATRVPVTEAPAIAQAPLAPPVETAKPVVIPSASQVPSMRTTAGQKTLWAQIGPFNDGQAAVNFWANYRMSHPDFPVVRVRVTSPYQQQMRGKTQTFLRVGPMARAGSIDNLCTSLKTMPQFTCGQVTDLGIAAPAAKTSGLLPGSRYAR